MRRFIGLDLNGWHDFACRDWYVDDPDQTAAALDIVDGGFGSVVVTHEGRAIGGPQAILSPIGRGNGWGRIGAAEKRRALADLWRDFLQADVDSHMADHMRAAVDALAVRAEHVMLCMPDHAGMAEARQQQLLGMLGGARRPRVTLLWRPVAVLLDRLEDGTLPGVTDGTRVACVVHGRDGLEVQHLVMRRLPDHPDHLAPERGRPGEVCCPDIGLAPLLAHAKGAVLAANPTLLERPTEASRLPLDLLFGEADPPAEEVLRRDNGNWVSPRAPSDFILPEPACDPRPACAGADLLLVLTPLARRHQCWLARYLSILGVPILMADPASAARGALRAARRIDRGIPHYLDRLDQISLAVLRGGVPVFEDLIPRGATVPGNREYISDPITSMSWTEGMTTARFYLRKGEHEIRHWVTRETIPPSRNERLEVRLRQMPAQGWARLTVTAPDWDVLRRDPIRLDWSALEIDPRRAEDILAALQGPPPVVPRRVRHQPDIGLWDGSLVQPGLSTILRQVDLANPAQLKRLADTLSRRYKVETGAIVYPVGTDGDLPESLDPESQRLFDLTIDRIAKRLLGDIARDVSQSNNQALRCLTWTFARCPDGIGSELQIAARCILADTPHPLLAPVASRTVVMQGLGRVISKADAIDAFIPFLSENLDRPNFLPALAFILSRPASAPQVLVAADLGKITDRLIAALRDLVGARNLHVKLQYALMAIAGLLRVREHDAWALVADRSAQARELVELLTEVHDYLGEPRYTSKRTVTCDLIKLLTSTGGRPDILTVMNEIIVSDEGSDNR